METIRIIIEYDGDVTLNNEFTKNVTKDDPLMLNWFPHNDLKIETKSDKIIFNTDNLNIEDENSQISLSSDDSQTYIIHLRKLNKTLHILASEEKEIFNEPFILELAKSDDEQKYLMVTDKNGKKYAHKLK